MYASALGRPKQRGPREGARDARQRTQDARLMLPAFVIALREGVEAALIVGIVAAFLIKSGRRDALRPVWIGVSLAALLCLGVGIALQVVNEELPYRQQEGFEAIVALVATGMVTYMVV